MYIVLEQIAPNKINYIGPFETEREAENWAEEMLYEPRVMPLIVPARFS